MKSTLETVGTITKKEILSTIEHDTDKALVLETKKPYPGFYGTTIPDQLKPISLFFVTDQKYSGEMIIRATMAVKKETETTFDAVPGLIQVFNTMSPAIRIKDLASYEKIAELISLYRKYGIDFMKSRNLESFEGLIKIRKYFSLDLMEDGIYHDIQIPEMVYFTIPTMLSWDVFEALTLNMKMDPDYNNFDAALGVFFTPKGVLDIVRIYRKEIELDDITRIRNKYLLEINRLA
jgi:hypothetical protein